MIIIFTVLICIAVSFLFTVLAKKLNLSVVIGLILSGIILGSPGIKNAIIGPNEDFVMVLGNLAFFILMFLAGLEISWCLLYQERKEATAVTFFAAIVPIILGFIVFLQLGFSLVTCLTVGISMSITAEATTARVLLELDKLNTQVGSLMMGAGIIDDMMGLTLFAVISYIFTGKTATHEFIQTLGAIGAFFLGIVVHKLIGREKPIVTKIEKFLLTFLIPFFFISMGIHFSFESLFLKPWMGVGVIVLAILGKIAGSMLAKPFTQLNWKQLYLVGWGMNSRGAVELALALLALQAGLIEKDVYSSLVLMALVTTLIFPIVLRRMLAKNPDIMGSTSKSCIITKKI
ncbi:MAG: cation:proton antiporter [Candidatus Aminicenantaceae bacterium]